jgi:hypothetical protein
VAVVGVAVHVIGSEATMEEQVVVKLVALETLCMTTDQRMQALEVHKRQVAQHQLQVASQRAYNCKVATAM